MGKLYKEPYKSKEYAADYNKYWVLKEDIKPSVDVEISIVEKLLINKKSWLDVACGTGYHLHNVKNKVEKFGVDKSKYMLDYAKSLSELDINFYQKDLTKDLKGLQAYDLVTNFGYGYSHQKNLQDVLKFIKNLSKLVIKSGDLLIGYDGVPDFITNNGWDNDLGKVKIKAVVTDYYQHSGTNYLNCISPTIDTLIETVRDDFKSVDVIKLPLKWKNTLLHLKDKRY